MEQGKPGTSESVEHVSHSADTEILPEDKKSLSSSDKSDAPSNDMPRISASSPEDSSKEAAEAKEEELPTIDPGTIPSEEKSCSGTKVTSSVETSNVTSKKETEITAKVLSPEASMPIPHESECVGAEAKPLADVPKPFTMEEIGKVMSDIMPQMATTSVLSKEEACGGAKPKTYFIQRPAPLKCYKTSGGKQKSPKSNRKFLRSRSYHLKNLSDELWKVKKFMNDITTNIAGVERVDSDEEFYVQLSEKWCSIFERWQTVQKNLDRVIQMTRRFLENTDENVTTTDVENYLDVLSFLQINMHELAILCYGALHKYRSYCDRFQDYEFMVHINTFPEMAEEAQIKITFELDMFGDFYRDSEVESSD